MKCLSMQDLYDHMREELFSNPTEGVVISFASNTAKYPKYYPAPILPTLTDLEEEFPWETNHSSKNTPHLDIDDYLGESRSHIEGDSSPFMFRSRSGSQSVVMSLENEAT